MSRGKPRVQKPTPVCWIHLSREQRRRLPCRPVLEDGAGAPSSAGRGASRVRRELPLRPTWTAASEGPLPIPDLVATALDLRGEDQERQGGGWRLRAHSCCSQVGIDACRSADLHAVGVVLTLLRTSCGLFRHLASGPCTAQFSPCR